MTDDDALKPCPFCGSRRVAILRPTRQAFGPHELLHRCKLVGDIRRAHHDRAALIDEWNTRHDRA